MTDMVELLKMKRERVLDLIEEAYCNTQTERKYDAVRQEVHDMFNEIWVKFLEESTNESHPMPEVKP